MWNKILRSGIPYESEVPPDIFWEDIDPEMITVYRRRRAKINASAAELDLGDEDLLSALRCMAQRDGKIVPNIAGLLLFGSKTALRRMMPMNARVDYIVTEGPEWVGDPSTRYYSTDYREALVSLLPRLHAQIMGDLPTQFSLETGHLQRTDIPSIPRNVIREALANALMHRDYRDSQPTQVIRYSNRLEFRNAGYSLKPFEELGKPGSKPRNPIIAAVFHELRYAETKGTGIYAMREWMSEAGLTTPPIIETARDRNEFDLVLLPHHLLDKEALKWLSIFRNIPLTDAQRRALVFTRKVGAITNQDYRQLNGTDTLAASAALRGLRDAGLLTQKGRGNGTYYVFEDTASQVSPAGKEGTPQVSPAGKGLAALPTDFPELPEELRKQLLNLKNRSTQREKIKEIIKGLCALRPLTRIELAKILDRNPTHLRYDYLSEMIKNKELEFTFPRQPAHPQQAYKTPSSLGDSVP